MARPITVEEATRLQQAALAKTRLAAPAPRLPEWRRVVDRKLARRHRPLVVHLVVERQLTSLRQLSGRLVSFRPKDAFEQAAAKKAFSDFGITVEQTTLDLDNALDGVATGDIGAVVIICHADLRKVRDLSAPNLQVVSLPGGARPSLRETASLEARRQAIR